MLSKDAAVAGTLLFVGGAQFIIALVIAEAVYPGYSVSANYISDLGVWGTPSAPIFNVSIMVFGLTVLVASVFLQRLFGQRLVSALFAIAGAGALGVGIFPENTLIVGGISVAHSISALLAFVGAGLAAILAYKITKPPFRYFGVVLGVVALVAFSFFLATRDAGALGLGAGGMERMVAYPTLVFMIALGGYLLNNERNAKTTGSA
jgi:hypothetical membrane protein